MKILSVSDYMVPALKKPGFDRIGGFGGKTIGDVDLIISCGDLPPEYLVALSAILDAPLFYVRGNHDIRYDTTPPAGCTNLDGRIVRFGGLNFLG